MSTSFPWFVTDKVSRPCLRRAQFKSSTVPILRFAFGATGGTTFASSSGATANAKPRRLGALPQKGERSFRNSEVVLHNL